MKTKQPIRYSLVLFALVAMIAATPADVAAQEPVLSAQTEHQYNDDIHAFILKRLRQTTLQREKQMNKQVQHLLINLPNAEKLYDETFVKITTEVQEDTTEEGRPEINFVI